MKLGDIRNGFFIGHTAERREELRSAFHEILVAGEIEPKQAERLRGRMQWFEGYAFGRIAQHSLRTLGDIALRKQRVVKLDTSEKEAIEFLVQRVSVKISAISLETMLVFTDGACEGSGTKSGGIGGVLVNQDGSCIHHFSFSVPDFFMLAALEKSDNPIYELELLRIYVSMIAWRPLLQGRHVVFYLDNDAARSAVCKGVGSTGVARRIVMGKCHGAEILVCQGTYTLQHIRRSKPYGLL